ncbi:uncharacterized protein DS421_4g111990 [Arachis hypogaea]|nr:uncharacterized protein DS421_4g111990 [Arachis hypogaea]
MAKKSVIHTLGILIIIGVIIITRYAIAEFQDTNSKPGWTSSSLISSELKECMDECQNLYQDKLLFQLLVCEKFCTKIFLK